MTSDASCLLYMTAPNRESALQIADALVEAKLVACVNILGPIDSVYQWRGVVTRDTEIAFIAKTRMSLVAAAEERVKALHSYDVPCIVALPIAGGHAPFLQWIVAETSTK